MTVSAEQLIQIQPRLLRCEGGAWLAVSEAGAPLGIGVLGETPDLARLRFAQALEEWAVLLSDEALAEHA